MKHDLNNCCVDLLQLIGHFVFICEDGVIVWINESGVRLLRSPTIDNVLGRPIVDFVTDDFAELFADGLGLMSEEPDGVPLQMLTATAESLDVSLQVSALDAVDGRQRHLVECQDISALIKASQATRSREHRMNAILETIDQAVITIDECG